MDVYLHKYYEEGELLMEIFLPHMTPIEWEGRFTVEAKSIKPTRVEPAYGDTSNVYFDYQGEEHVVLVNNSQL